MTNLPQWETGPGLPSQRQADYRGGVTFGARAARSGEDPAYRLLINTLLHVEQSAGFLVFFFVISKNQAENPQFFISVLVFYEGNLRKP